MRNEVRVRTYSDDGHIKNSSYYHLGEADFNAVMKILNKKETETETKTDATPICFDEKM